MNKLITPTEFFDRVREACKKVAERRELSKSDADMLLKAVNISFGIIDGKTDTLKVFSPLAKQPKARLIRPWWKRKGKNSAAP